MDNNKKCETMELEGSVGAVCCPEGNTTKQCNNCNIVKTTDKYYTNGKKKNGDIKYYSYCKTCARQHNKQRYEKNKDKVNEESGEVGSVGAARCPEGNATKQCTKCNVVKTIDDFYKRTTKNGIRYGNQCIVCLKEHATYQNQIDNKQTNSKICRVCSVEKTFDEYMTYNALNGDIRYRGECRVCHKNQIKKFKTQNKDIISETGKKYYKKNKHKIIPKTKKYREDNKEIISERGIQYRENNKCEHGRRPTRCKDGDCVGQELCKSEFCTTAKNKNYDDYCTHCFAHLFPSDPRTLKIHKASKEIRVISYINQYFEGFIHDKPLYVDLKGGCCDSKRRIDLRKLIISTLLGVEVDEHQHKGYNKQDELNRYDNLFLDFSGRYIFIRYNPDKYKDDKGVVRNPSFKTRMKVLIKEIEKQIKKIEDEENKELVEIIYLYYDGYKA